MNGFEIKDGVLVKYTGTETDVVIPAGVTTIGKYAFYGCSNLQSIVIPDSVTTIGDGAFLGCKNLQSISIPDSVTTIGNSAFYGCSNLQSISIPDSVTSIGYSAFYWCSNLQSISIPDSVTSIGYSTFYKCSNLQSITIPDSVTSIGNGAFFNCDNLQNITIPDSVTSIGDSAFSYCSNLQSISISDSVTTIYNNAFSGCENLQSIYAPKMAIERFGSPVTKRAAAFGYLQNPDLFTDFEIAERYKKHAIGQRKKFLPDIFKNDMVASLAFYAEEKKITAANFETEYLNPATEANAIECVAFLLDWQNKNISLKDVEKQFEKELMKDPYNVADMKKLWSYEKLEDGTLRLTSYKGAETEVNIPPYIGKSVVSRLGDCVFGDETAKGTNKPESIRKNLAQIESIFIGDNIKEIGANAFKGCEGLKKITIPDSVTTIGTYAFYGCKNLQSICGVPGSYAEAYAKAYAKEKDILFTAMEKK